MDKTNEAVEKFVRTTRDTMRTVVEESFDAYWVGSGVRAALVLPGGSGRRRKHSE